MFLVGVFLTDAAPSGSAPSRLDFTDREEFNLLEPEIGQTFLIGDGVGHGIARPRARPGSSSVLPMVSSTGAIPVGMTTTPEVSRWSSMGHITEA